jgi:hypothetical protein
MKTTKHSSRTRTASAYKVTTEHIINHKKDPHEWETRAVRYLPILELDHVTLALAYLPRARKPDAYIAIYTPTNQSARLTQGADKSVEDFIDGLVKNFGSLETARLSIIERMHQMKIIKTI